MHILVYICANACKYICVWFEIKSYENNWIEAKPVHERDRWRCKCLLRSDNSVADLLLSSDLYLSRISYTLHMYLIFNFTQNSTIFTL